MVVILMPGGAVQQVRNEEILWYRQAFKVEWDGATMVMLASGRIYSRESESDLAAKFTSAGVRLVTVTPPDADILMTVNAGTVRQVDDASSGIFGQNARSLLVFFGGPHLAVRETPGVIRQKLGLPAMGSTMSA
jgi:hypothetical protein